MGSKSQLPLSRASWQRKASVGLLNLAKVLEESSSSANPHPSTFGQGTSISSSHDGDMSTQGKHREPEDQNGSAGRGKGGTP